MQAFASEQGFESSFIELQTPEPGLQRSSVQALPSLQVFGAPAVQRPERQVSARVHALPSSHGELSNQPPRCRQAPASTLHSSRVQPFPSSQVRGAPAAHRPSAQRSLTVQAFPSSQGAVLKALVQPAAGAQLSVVQTFPSSQVTAPPLTQLPAKQ